MIQKRTLLVLIILALFIGACASGASEPSSAADMAPMEESAAEAESAFDAASAGNSAAPASQEVVQEQLIIRTATMRIIVDNTETALDAINEMAGDVGGWVVSSNVQQSGNSRSGEIIVRVPVSRFDEALNQIEALALEVTSASTTGEDVTDQYVDLSARLRNLEATAERVRGFLDETQDVEEALAVNAELSRLESEIEVLKGRLQYLEQSAAFSTIRVNLTPDELSEPIEVGWRPLTVVRDAVEALITLVQGLANIAIWVIVVVIPVLVLILLPLWLLFTLVRRLMRRRRREEPTAAGSAAGVVSEEEAGGE